MIPGVGDREEFERKSVGFDDFVPDFAVGKEGGDSVIEFHGDSGIEREAKAKAKETTGRGRRPLLEPKGITTTRRDEDDRQRRKQQALWAATQVLGSKRKEEWLLAS
jgi:hypothetical protein